MGIEAQCSVEWQGRAVEGKALLETTEVIFRGPIRLKIPRDRITAVVAEAGALRVSFDAGTATFVLGAAAEKWARALATVKSRLDKLGVGPRAAGQAVSVVGVEDASFRDELRASIGAFVDGAPVASGDVVFFGVHTLPDLDRIPALVATLKPAGALWVIRPKGHAEVTEAAVRAAGLRAGLVDVKVASFSPTHSAAKFVIPIAARRGPAATAHPSSRSRRSR